MASRLHPIARDIAVLSRAGYPLVYMVTHEEDRAVRLIEMAAAAGKRKYVEWSVVDAADDGPQSALELVASTEEPSLFVLLDFHAYLAEATLLRNLRERLADCADRRQTVVIVAPELHLPVALQKDTAVIDLPLPNITELTDTLRQVARSEKVELTSELEERAVRSALGLSQKQASRVFRKVMVLRRGLKEDDLRLVVEEKKQVLRTSDVLEFYDLSDGLGDVGGLGEMKRWLQARTAAFGPDAERFGLPPPKGLLLLGVQGCGKSLSAKAVADLWKFPLLRLDVGALFAGGSSGPEGALRHSIKVAESLAPVVMWIDEIEKGFAGGGEGESSSRVFGSLITWLSEKKAQVFVIATANDVSNLPPELLRRGRFDEIFFVDLPNAHERHEILRIHLHKRQRDPNSFSRLEQIAKAAEHFSGAELEQVVISGLYLAFAEKRELREDDLLHAVKHTVPLFRTYEEKIKALRDWAKRRARPATLDTSVLDMFDAG